MGVLPDVERTVVPMLSKHEDKIVQNSKLLRASMRFFVGQRSSSNSRRRAAAAVDDRYKQFVRQGAKLSRADKDRLSKINQRPSQSFTDFSQNVWPTSKGYVTWIEDQADLAGLPTSIVAAGMATAAKERSRSSGLLPIRDPRSIHSLTYAENRSLRNRFGTLLQPKVTTAIN
ncbi:MAG: hypothetical protein R3C56_14425 [Pirellulaceae bacterium]